MILLVKILVVVHLHDHDLLHPDAGLDTTAYASLARQVLSGNLGLGPGLYFVSPLYIYFLAAILFATGSFTAVRVVQVLLGTAAVACIWLTAREWFGPRAGLIAGTLAGLTGLFTFYEALILQSSLDVFLTSAALLASSRGLVRRSAGLVAVAGIVLGVAVLNRPNLLLAAGGLTMACAAARRWRLALVLATGVMAGLAPVALRNLIVADQWSLVSSHGGLNFLIGNGEGATGFYRALPGITPNIAGQQRDAERVASRALGRPVTDAEASDYFFGLAWGWIRTHPGDALVLFVKKLGWVFHAQHVALPHSFPFYADHAWLLRLLVVGPWLLIPLGVVGLVAAMPAAHRQSYLIWLSFVPAYAISVAVFFVAERYRLPLLVPLAIGAGAAIDAAIRLLQERRFSVLALPATAVAIVAVAANWDHGLTDGRFQEATRMAERLVIVGRYDDAEEWVRRLDAVAPDPANVHFVVGVQYRVAGRHTEAIDHLTRALQLDPEDANVHAALGQSLLAAGRAVDAVPHLRRAVDQRASLGVPRLDLAVALQQTGDLAGAAIALDGLVAAELEDAELCLRAGRLAVELKAADIAAPFFRRAAELQPQSAAARLQYGLTLLGLKRLDEAIGELSAAVRLDPRDPDALVQLAYAEFLVGRLADARAHTAAALAIAPSHPLARQLAEAIR